MTIPVAGGLALLIVGCTTPLSPPAARQAATLPDAVVQYALESVVSGKMITWHAADSERHGTITPVRTFRAASGYCREYAATLSEPDGEGRTWHELACRDGGGRWRKSTTDV